PPALPSANTPHACPSTTPLPASRVRATFRDDAFEIHLRDCVDQPGVGGSLDRLHLAHSRGEFRRYGRFISCRQRTRHSSSSSATAGCFSRRLLAARSSASPRSRPSSLSVRSAST